MNLQTNEKDITVISVVRLSKEYQVVVDKDTQLQPGGIVVFVLKDGQEILGVITDYDDNDEHRIIYVETNPKFKQTEITINNLETILLWGSLV